MAILKSPLFTLSYPIALAFTLLIIGGALYFLRRPAHFERKAKLLFKKHILKHTIPVSVNFHFTRKCNAECGFCFHTETTSHLETLDSAKHCLRLLYNEGMQKLNFAGGEPFLYPKHLGELCRFVKQDLGLQSVSIVSNGTKVTKNWLQMYGRYIDILAISCDSFQAATNTAIGRRDRGTKVAFDNVAQLFQIRDWCRQLGIKFKLNTVVCALNWEEDMAETVQDLAPFRWKVFQVLVVEGENENDKRVRDARKLLVSKEQFEDFCRRHEAVKGFTPESNELMKSSYLILDEYMQFLDGADKTKHSESILKVGVQKALGQVEWDQQAFSARGGVYDWTRVNGQGECGGGLQGVPMKDLEF